MKATKKTYELNFSEPCAIVMGIYPALLKICDEKFQIPMTGDFDSLNVSVATGIILYEATKQRNP
jgi:23S rRNA (guanosine2251-2'-O)-methyltransferase